MRGALLALLIALLPAAGAGAKVYEGPEAAALRCANTLALTAVALDGAGLLGPGEREVLLGITVLILERHVSGTWAQKKAALAQVRDRRDLFETLKDFERFASRCVEQFPIN